MLSPFLWQSKSVCVNMKVCVLCVFAVQCVRQVPQRRRGALLLLQGPLRLPHGPLTPTPGPPPRDPHPGTPNLGPPTWDPHPGGLMNKAGDPSHRADPTAFRRRMRRTRSRVFITGASPYRRHWPRLPKLTGCFYPECTWAPPLLLLLCCCVLFTVSRGTGSW